MKKREQFDFFDTTGPEQEKEKEHIPTSKDEHFRLAETYQDPKARKAFLSSQQRKAVAGKFKEQRQQDMKRLLERIAVAEETEKKEKQKRMHPK